MDDDPIRVMTIDELVTAANAAGVRVVRAEVAAADVDAWLTPVVVPELDHQAIADAVGGHVGGTVNGVVLEVDHRPVKRKAAKR